MLYLFVSAVVLYSLGFGVGAAYKIKNPDRPIRWKDVINPMKWVSIAVSAMLIRLVPPHVVEQLALRLYDDECRSCVARGFCHGCGCNMPEKAFDPYAFCSEGNWGAIVFDPVEYGKIREQYPINIKITYQ